MQAGLLLQVVLEVARELRRVAHAARVGAVAWRGVDRVRGRVALVGDVGRQLGHVGHAGGRAGLVLALGEGRRVEHEQRRRADHRERGEQAWIVPLVESSGVSLESHSFTTTLRQATPPILLWASPHALTASIEPWNSPGANGEPVSAITKIVIDRR